MILETIPAIQRLTTDQKLLLVSELWRDISEPSAPPSPELAALLEERVAEYHANPEDVVTTAELTALMIERKQQWATRQH